MSMNILVKTRVEPEKTFQRNNDIIMAGEIAINREGNYAKIGDGVTEWARLAKIENKEIIDKWLQLVNKTSNSHLVTLPDMNFAYSIITADSNAMVEQIIRKLMTSNNYFSITEESREDTDVSDIDGILTLSAGGVQNIFFDTPEENKKTIVSQLCFKNKDEIESRIYNFYDRDAQENIKWIKEIKMPTIEKEIEIIQGTLDIHSNSINTINNSIGLFELNKNGIVKAPKAEENSENYFLTGINTWKMITLTAANVLTNDNQTVQVKLDDIYNRINNGGTQLSIGTIEDQETKNYVGTVNGLEAESIQFSEQVYISNNVLLGAAYNDYAEARETNSVAAGRVVVENGDDTLSISTERLMLGGNIVSDTYGMLIGETDTAKTPIALCGRVLAYPNEDRSEYYAGAPVCTGPNGTVSVMSKDEVLHYPECIIGYVSAVPAYEEWNGKKVNGRIWIKVV